VSARAEVGAADDQPDREDRHNGESEVADADDQVELGDPAALLVFDVLLEMVVGEAGERRARAVVGRAEAFQLGTGERVPGGVVEIRRLVPAAEGDETAPDDEGVRGRSSP
jgi:hypothetical protein